LAPQSRPPGLPWAIVGSSTFFRFRLSPTLNEASDEGAEAPFLEAKFLPTSN